MQVEAAFDAALGVLRPSGRVAVAVSGGPDSVALMRLAAGLKPLVLTVDHGLRAGSAAEAAQVAAWAAALGLEHRTLNWIGEKPAAGVQAAARAARYALLADACRAAGADLLLTGHTLDDQIETVAMRQSKGSGAAGLAGMPFQTFLPGAGGAVRLGRPLIWVRKAALLAMLEREAIAFVTDPSNADMRFERARMRAGAPQTISVDEIAAAQRLRLGVETAALQFLDTAVCSATAVMLDRTAFAQLSDAVGDAVIAAVLRRVGGRGYPGTQTERRRVLEALRSGAVFRGRTLAGAIIRPATRAEGGRGHASLVFAPETAGSGIAGAWWLPFAQLAQLGPDGVLAAA